MKTLRTLALSLLAASVAAGLAQPVTAETNWFADAVWYQIFPERFRNGDPANDPTPASLAGTWPYFVPKGWQVVPWTSDWYQSQPWEQDGRGFYVHAQLRRYGGDLQGIIDELDYLKALGVNALYLNPIFESPSLHKYGATMYHHVDRHFGPDPQGDLKLFNDEDPANPATWKWTAADKLFLQLIKEAHRRDLRVVIDGVFNHVGIPFWALQRAKKEGPDSRFAKWFQITRWDDPATPADERPNLHEYTQVIMKEADRLQSLMDRLLTPHRLPQPAPLNIHEVLERVRSLIIAEYPRDIVIRRDYDTSLPLLKGDKEQMIQVVLNVVRNAAQAMRGSGQIRLRTRIARQVTLARKRYKHALELQITDSGPGIPEEMRERIFYPLVSGREGGTGLGLTLAQTFVTRHHGTITFESQPGSTTFTLMLPIDAV